MKRLCLIVALAVLAGCGADGDPIQPSMSANVGVTPNGVSGSTGVSINKGPISVGVGLGL